MTVERLFCVFTFSRVIADYECIGVFTKEEDAKAFRDASPHNDPKVFRNGLPVVRWTFAELTDHLVRYRLGKLADVLFAKEAAVLEAPSEVMLPSGTNPLPADVTVRD